MTITPTKTDSIQSVLDSTPDPVQAEREYADGYRAQIAGESERYTSTTSRAYALGVRKAMSDTCAWQS